MLSVSQGNHLLKTLFIGLALHNELSEQRLILARGNEIGETFFKRWDFSFKIGTNGLDGFGLLFVKVIEHFDISE